MNQIIQAVYENGILRPLAPLDLLEDSVVEIDVRDVAVKLTETPAEKAVAVLRQAGLTSSFKPSRAEKLDDTERHRLRKLFSGGKPLSDYINEDREERG